MTTDNFEKHTTKNPLQKFLIDAFFRTLMHEIKRLNPETVLDAGCGEGFGLQKLHMSGIGKTLEGVDLERAVLLGRKTHPELTLTVGSIYALPYADNTFDLVLCSEVLEHLEYPEKAIAELRRVTKKYCIITVPNEPYFRLANFLRGKNLSRWGNDIEHIQHWSVRSLKVFVSKFFTIRTVRTPFPWSMVILEK